MSWYRSVVTWLQQLDVIDWQFLALLWGLTALALAATIYLAVRHAPHRLRRSIIAGFAAVALGVLATADMFNAYYAYLPTINDAQQAVTGDRQWHRVDALTRLQPAALETASISGTVVKMPLPADRADDFAATTNIAYLPPQYFTEPTRRFPVVYLFHGSPGKAEDWFHAGRAARAGNTLARLGRPAILVAAQMSRSWTDDPECVDGAKEKVESHLIRQVIPAVDATFRTQRDRQSRIFGGMSAGGYCALNLGLRHRDLVGTIVDLSGETVPTHSGGARALFGAKNPQAGALVAANSPSVYASRLSAKPATRVWLETGADDHTIAREMTALARTLTSRGLTVENRVRPGGHTYYVWTAALGEALPWALGGDAPPPERTSHH